MSQSADDHADEASSSTFVMAARRTGRACVGRIGRRPGRRQSGQLAHASRIRVGKPCLETLDPVLFRALPFVRFDERGCGMSEWHGGPLRSIMGGDLESVIDAARRPDRSRCLASHSVATVHPLRDPASGTAWLG